MARSVPCQFATPVELLVPPTGWIVFPGELHPLREVAPAPLAQPTDAVLIQIPSEAALVCPGS